MAAYLYLAIITFLFCFGIFYAGIDYAMESGRDSLKGLTNTSTDDIATYSALTETQLYQIWKSLPVFMLVVCLMVGIIVAQKEED
jgi:Na+/H+ antiporter NhaC